MNKQRLVTGVILFLSLVAFGAAIALSQVVVTKLDALRESSHDNILWSLQRLELEAANLDASAKDASQTGEFAEFQQSFDIFASRVATFNDGPQFAPLRQRDSFQATLGQLLGFIRRTIPLVDDPNTDPKRIIAIIQNDLPQIRQFTNDIALDGLTGITLKTAQDRAELYRTLRNLGLVSLGLVLLLGTFGLYVTGREREASHLAVVRQELLRSMETVINASLDAIVTIDANGKVTGFNPAAERIFGYSKSALMGKEITHFLVPEKYRDVHKAGLMRAVRDGQYRLVGKGRVHMQALRASGEEFAMDMLIERIGSDDQLQFVAFIRDASTLAGSDSYDTDKDALHPRDLQALSILISGLGRSVVQDHPDTAPEWLTDDLHDLGQIIQILSASDTADPTPYAFETLLQNIVTYINSVRPAGTKPASLEWEHLPIRQVHGNRAVLRAMLKLLVHQVMLQLPNPVFAFVVQEVAHLGGSQLIELRLIIDEDASNRHQILSDMLFVTDGRDAAHIACPTFAKLIAHLGANIALQQINQKQSAIALKIPVHSL